MRDVLGHPLQDLALVPIRIGGDSGREVGPSSPGMAEFCILKVRVARLRYRQARILTAPLIVTMLRTSFSVWTWEISHRFPGPAREFGADPRQ